MRQTDGKIQDKAIEVEVLENREHLENNKQAIEDHSIRKV